MTPAGSVSGVGLTTQFNESYPQLPGMAPAEAGIELPTAFLESAMGTARVDTLPLAVATTANSQVQMLKLQTELGQMKIDTMYKMVDEVKINLGDNRMVCPLLYLTNDQAAAFNVQSMAKVRSALSLKEPKMVIRLLPSRFGSNYWKGFPFSSGSRDGGRYPTKRVPELSMEDRAETEHRLTLLVKEIILPLAMRNRAFIVGMSDCALMSTVIKVFAPVKRQLGEACPFQLLQFSYAYMHQLSTEIKYSQAQKFREQSPAWSQVDFRPALAKRFGDDRAFWPHYDFLPGQYATILFEALSPHGAIYTTPADIFQNEFISALALNLPVIGIQTYGAERLSLAPAMADHANKGLPLLMLDSRKREDNAPATMDEVQDYLFAKVDELHALGVSDLFTTSTVAFVKSAIDHFANREQAAKDDDPKRQWLWQAIDHCKGAKQDIVSAASQPDPTQPPDLLDHTIVKGTNFLMSYVGKDMEWESSTLTGRCGQAIENIEEATNWKDLKRQFEDDYLKIRGSCFHKYDKLVAFSQKHPWAVFKDYGKDTHEGRFVFGISLEQTVNADFESSKQSLIALLNEQYNACLRYDGIERSEAAFVANEDLWLAVYDILKSKSVYSGNLHNLVHVEKQLFNIARIDRLPESNTLEGLVLLRRAWTLIDVFNRSAWYYKRLSKASYLIFILLTVAIVTITIVGAAIPDNFSATAQQGALLALGLFGSFLAGVTALTEPYKKWMQLRGGALALQAEIWKFRTRSGDYAMPDALNYTGRQQAERKAEQLFQDLMLSVQDMVLVSAGLKETSFYSWQTSTDDVYVDAQEFKEFTEKKTQKPSSKIAPSGVNDPKSQQLKMLAESSKPKTKKTPKSRLRHGQYQGTTLNLRPAAGQDSFHAPATSHEYIRWRLVPAVEFYQSRIPVYARKRRIIQALMLLASVTIAFLAAFQNTPWAAIVASISMSIAAWQEYEGLVNKLERFSTVANALMNTLMWWQALPEVDQANVTNVEHLVQHTEDLINSEHAAWLSDVQQAARMSRALSNGQALRVGEGGAGADDTALSFVSSK